MSSHDAYLKCMKQTDRIGLRQLLLSLASQEKEHAKKIEDLLSSVDPEEVFDKFDEEGFDPAAYAFVGTIEASMNYNDILMSIIDMEERTFRLYSLLAESTGLSEVSFLFSALAFEEQKHKSWAVDRYELEMLKST